MDNEEKKNILQRFYYEEKNPAAYAGAQKLFSVLNKKYPGVYTISGIKQWINDQDAYSLQKPRRLKFKTANVRVTAIGEQLDIDLLSMSNLADENDGVRFLLCAIDILSRKLWVRPLANKTAKVVLTAMKDIILDISPTRIQKIRADKGSEFSNQWFKKYLKDRNIYFFTTNNPPKSNYVERVQRTLKEKLYRMMRHKRTYRYIDDLQDVVASYNATPHRGLHGLAPNEVDKNNEADV
jgi:IS30 family transposase